MSSSKPPDPATRSFHQDLLALRAYARARMSAQLLTRESPSDIVQAVCEDLLKARSAAADASGSDDAAALRQLVRWKIQERHRYWTRQKRRGQIADAGSPEHHPGASSGPESTAVLRERLRALRASVEALPPRQRDAIRMYYFDGRPLAEVGAALKCSEDAAKMLVSRAMQELRRTQEK